MDTKELYREILNEHNINPTHKKDLSNATIKLQGVNPSCGDNITLNLFIENGTVKDGSFVGSGCAVSQASCDMMLDLVIGKDINTVMELQNNFMQMIQGEASEEQIESLDEAASLQDISKMPARVKCAVLGWRTLKECIETNNTNATKNCECCSN